MLISASSLSAQEEEGAPDIVASYNATTEAIGKNQFDAALELCNKIIDQYGDAEKGRELFGPVYGHWFYMRGLAYIGLKDWDAASTNFEICYLCTDKPEKVLQCKNCRGFGRITKTSFEDKDPDGKIPCPECGGITYRENSQPNGFRMHSLVQWGNCRMIQEDFAKARDLYRKALAEDHQGKLTRNWKLYVAVNLGRCLIKAGDVEEGYEYTIRALESPDFNIALKQVVFQILANDWSPLVDSEPVQNFIYLYDYVPISAPMKDRVPLNPVFYNLANLALEQNDPILSLSWLRLIGHPAEVVFELDQGIALLEARKVSDPREEVIPLIDKEIEKQKKQRAQLKDNLWAMLSTTGMSHYRMKNYGASLAVYDELSRFAPKTHEGRPEFLHNAVVSAVQIKDWATAYEHGKTFLAEFPQHKLMPGVVRILVELIFIQGNYQESYDISREVREDMEVGSPIRDIPDFVYGASAYQLGKFVEAEANLTAYLKNYQPAQRAELAKYYLGSTKIHFYKWQEATDLFDPFLKDYPGSPVTSSVLYQNGLSKFMLDDNEAALQLVVNLIENYSTAEEVPAGWNLRGDINSINEADYDTKIYPAYENAISTSALIPGKEEIAAYAIWQLMMNLADLERWEEAGTYFDRFQKEHPDSGYRVDMLIGSLETLVELGRGDEAIQRQEDLLFATGGDPERGELGELFATYLEFIQENDSENVAERLDKLAMNNTASPALKAWAQIGQIEVLEKADGDHDEAIQAKFYLINNGFKPEEHSNYVIVRLARWHSVTRKRPDEAAPLYDYILESREGTDDFDLALLDRAEIDATSDIPEDRSRAMENFDRILNEFGNAELAETASVGVARLLTADKKFAEALPRWEDYMDNSGWNKFASEANYNYALCLDQTGKTKEALVVYINTYNAFPGHADFSTASYLRAALLMKEKKEDLKALLILKDMLTRLKNIDHPNKDKGLKLFEKWKSEYVPPRKEAA